MACSTLSRPSNCRYFNSGFADIPATLERPEQSGRCIAHSRARTQLLRKIRLPGSRLTFNEYAALAPKPCSASRQKF